MASEADVLTAAYRRLGVVAEDEEQTATQAVTAQGIWRSIWARMNREAPLPFFYDAIPDESFDAAADLVAAYCATSEGETYGIGRAQAMRAFLSTVRVDNRDAVETETEFY